MCSEEFMINYFAGSSNTDIAQEKSMWGMEHRPNVQDNKK